MSERKDVLAGENVAAIIPFNNIVPSGYMSCNEACSHCDNIGILKTLIF